MPKSLIAQIEKLTADIQELYISSNNATLKLARAQLKDPYPPEIRTRVEELKDKIRFVFYDARSRRLDATALSCALENLKTADEAEFKAFVDQIEECATLAAHVISISMVDQEEHMELYVKLKLEELEKVYYSSSQELAKILGQNLDIYRVKLTEQHLYPKDSDEKTLQAQEKKLLDILAALEERAIASNSPVTTLLAQAKEYLNKAPDKRTIKPHSPSYS